MPQRNVALIDRPARHFTRQRFLTRQQCCVKNRPAIAFIRNFEQNPGSNTTFLSRITFTSSNSVFRRQLFNNMSPNWAEFTFILNSSSYWKNFVMPWKKISDAKQKLAVGIKTLFNWYCQYFFKTSSLRVFIIRLRQLRGPITKISQSECFIASPTFSKYRTG